ncbi:MAG: hypothetical protein IJ759_00830 [Bacteroidales bacterium]|nr:hypothetical protein [Bacteroidales bacterium]
MKKSIFLFSILILLLCQGINAQDINYDTLETLEEYIYKDFFKEFFTHKITQFAIRQGTFIGCFTRADRIMEYLPEGDSMVCKQMTYGDSVTEFYHSFALEDLLSLFRDIEKNYSADKPTFTDFDIAKEDIEFRRLNTVSKQKTVQFLNYNLSAPTLTRRYSYEEVFSAIIHNPNGDKLQIIFHLANLQAFGLPLVIIKNDKDQIISYNCALGKLLKEAFLDADNINRPRFKSLTDSFDYWQEDLYRKSTANQNR